MALVGRDASFRVSADEKNKDILFVNLFDYWENDTEPIKEIIRRNWIYLQGAAGLVAESRAA